MIANPLSGPGLESLPHFLTALGIGLLLGLERERNPTAKAGLRTFALIALTGAAAQFLGERLSSPAIVAAGLVSVSVAIVAAYYHHHDAAHDVDPGTTTIAAVMACYLLAALAMAGLSKLASILAVLATLLLYFKSELSGTVRGLGRRDIVSILQFAVVTFVVLPLLPDQGFGPYGALNPRHVWLMVVLVSGMSLAGYVALRLAGPTRGPVLAGVMGGMVSSTATTLSFSRLARESPQSMQAASVAIIVANLMLAVRIFAVAAVAAPPMLPVLAIPLGAALFAGGLVQAVGARGAAPQAAEGEPTVANPIELRAALAFAAAYGVVLVASAWVSDMAGGAGVAAVALASGVVDVDAAVLSTLRIYKLGSISSFDAAVAVVAALGANAVFKLAILRRVGGAALFRACVRPIAAMVLAAAAAMFLA